MTHVDQAGDGRIFRRGLVCAARLAVFSLALSLASAVHADVRLPAVLNSHMVLQRDQPLPVWGWADAGEKVTVSIDDHSATATADDKGKWSVTLPPMKADGKAHSVKVAGNNTITLEDVLIGEVWVGSGQSNMEWQLKNTIGAPEAISAANHPNVRLFHVKKVQKPAPADDVEVTAHWGACTPDSVPAFSAALYYFGRRLQADLDVPVGLINSSWGGSPIEPWTVTDEGSGGMYNGMIAPLQPFAMRGAIWYQGETNVMQKNGLGYFDKTRALIEGWRKTWNPELPFYFVQIAPWSGRYEEGQLPALWEAQVASLKIPRTGMAVTTDLVDNIADIHPRNKLDVGNRLALWALAKTYGKSDIVYSGPLYRSMKVDGSSIRVEFAHAGGGLKSRDDKALTEFQIAGADGKFVEAVAKIDGKTVVISSPNVAEPKHVRFGWHKVANPNLINSEGLPASPFQTNDWQGGTGE
ncbi:MAG: sialate O-acetylesterase [Planctomycetota bacterium]|nr:sialate O-acetylesterase [Planctomycetota bacterium]